MKMYTSFVAIVAILISSIATAQSETVDAEKYLRDRISAKILEDKKRHEMVMSEAAQKIDKNLTESVKQQRLRGGVSVEPATVSGANSANDDQETSIIEVDGPPRVLRVAGDVVIFSYLQQEVPVRRGEFIGGYEVRRVNSRFIIMEKDGVKTTHNLL